MKRSAEGTAEGDDAVKRARLDESGGDFEDVDPNMLSDFQVNGEDEEEELGELVARVNDLLTIRFGKMTSFSLSIERKTLCNRDSYKSIVAIKAESQKVCLL